MSLWKCVFFLSTLALAGAETLFDKIQRESRPQNSKELLDAIFKQKDSNPNLGTDTISTNASRSLQKGKGLRNLLVLQDNSSAPAIPLMFLGTLANSNQAEIQSYDPEYGEYKFYDRNFDDKHSSTSPVSMNKCITCHQHGAAILTPGPWRTLIDEATSSVLMTGKDVTAQMLQGGGGVVNFVKLDQWLSKLHISRFAQLQGSILISLFGFEVKEVPFVKQQEKNAVLYTLRSIENVEKDTEEWHFRQGNSVFVHNNPKMLRKNLRRSLRYVDYAPIETTSNFITNFSHSLSEIEE